MQLTVRERLIILSILPKEGDFLTLKLLRKLQSDLSFNEEEHNLYKFVENKEDNSITWDDKVEQVKEIEIGNKTKDIIVNSLKKLNDQKKLNESHYDVYIKFVGDPEAVE
jgi:hypothetical protein